ncbi:ATP-binding cassette domain-containing protein [Macrococcus equipercicus]|nr:ATP-binding cassette domain-containing protein [Macrococcus equipercicus]
MQNEIIIRGARENNLKNLNINIPLYKSTVVAGMSGSGKSSLVYNVIYQESQRAFLENLPIQTIGSLIKTPANVDSIKNLPAAFSVSQTSFNRNPRSTLGTFTDISNYLRSLFSILINSMNQENYRDNDFSFNNPKACCAKCNGTGLEYVADLNSIIGDKNNTLNEGVLPYFNSSKKTGEFELLKSYCNDNDIPMDIPFVNLSKKQVEQLLYSEDHKEYNIRFKNAKGKYRTKKSSFTGAYNLVVQSLNDINKSSVYKNIKPYIKLSECSNCNGLRLNNHLLELKILNKNISEVERLNLNELLEWLKNVNEKFMDDNINKLINLIQNKLNPLIEMKLNYLFLDRIIPTLSGGELQRVRLSNQLNNPLIGVMYIFDEPCKGLHKNDIPYLINAFKKLVSKNNTLISIEHNEKFITEMDNVIYMGPSGGYKGGKLLSYEEFYDLNNNPMKKYNKRKFKGFIKYENINANNLSNFKCSLPTRGLTALVGVSGSGKSTLMSMMYDKFRSNDFILKDVSDSEKINQIYILNQQPIHNNKKSKVVTYLEVFDHTRHIYATLEEAKKRDFDISHFSFNSSKGNCNHCGGMGEIQIEMSYLEDIYIKCDRCNGSGYNSKVLEIQYKGLNIADFLNTEVDKLIEIISSKSILYKKLSVLSELGMGYIKLNQASQSLSGGEAQRIKLAKVLGKSKKENVAYLLDEPTTGLNKKDIDRLSGVLHTISKHNQVVVIEHNETFIENTVDYLIDLGLKANTNIEGQALEGHYSDIINKSSIN